MKIFTWLIKYLITKTKEKKIENKNYRLKTFLLKIFLILTMIEASLNSEINLVIQGNGEQKLSNIEPSEVLVNGIRNESCKKTCNLTGDKNNITLIYEDQITYCINMFRELTNVIEVDLSNFDTSELISMKNMFLNCMYLESINFTGVDTSLVTNMESMFCNSYKLT